MTTATETKAPETHPPGQHTPLLNTSAEQPRLTRGSWIGMAIVTAVIAAVVIFGITTRRGGERTLEKETAASAIPSVNVVYPTPSTLSAEIALPGNTRPLPTHPSTRAQAAT